MSKIKSSYVSRTGSVVKTATQTALQLFVDGVFKDGVDHKKAAERIRESLGGLKGPIMKIAQMLGNIPGALPDGYREEFLTLQSHAPSMGAFFVKRRMKQELGGDYLSNFQEFDEAAFRAASLGQVHRARLTDGREVVCKLQYPDMKKAVQIDLKHFRFFAKAYQAYAKGIHFADLLDEIEERLCEELDYELEAKNISLFQEIFSRKQFSKIAPSPECPDVIRELSTKKLLTMQFLKGAHLDSVELSQDERSTVGQQLFGTWYYPFYSEGVIHGDPHMGNYQISDQGKLQIMDFGCVRHFSKAFIDGIVGLYRGILNDDFDRCYYAFEQWGFENLTKELAEVLLVWARYFYEPLIDDRVRPISEGYSSEEGRLLAKKVIQSLRKKGTVSPPREFVFLDRATVGIGGALMLLRAENNWHQEFENILSLCGYSDG